MRSHSGKDQGWNDELSINHLEDVSGMSCAIHRSKKQLPLTEFIFMSN